MGSARPAQQASYSLRERIWRAVPDLPFWPELMQFLGWLGIRRFLKRTYCRMFGPDGGVVTLEAGGLETKLYVHAQYIADSLRRLQGEGPMLELMIRTLRPGDCAYDIGAERGLFTFFLAEAVGKRGQVIAFEPYSEAYEHLQNNINLNGARNVRVLRMALSDYDGDAQLFSGSPGYAPTLRDLRNIEVKMPVAERVRVAKGDTLVTQQNLPLPRAVKIDAEGCELSVIDGLSRTLADPTCRLLCCEIHPRQLSAGVTPEMILTRIKSLQFAYIDVKPRGATLHAMCRKS